MLGYEFYNYKVDLQFKFKKLLAKNSPSIPKNT